MMRMRIRRVTVTAALCMGSRELGAFLAAQYAEFKSILSELGLAK